MHALKLECREQGCGTVAHLTVTDLSEDKHVSLDEAQYYVNHRVPAKCGICGGHDWVAYGVSYVPTAEERRWASVS